MANVVVVGAQWGDEGKGKIVDWLSERADVISRFQSMEVDLFDLTSALNCVMSQRLMRELCPACKEPCPLPEGEPGMVSGESKRKDKVFRAKGCDECGHTGYAGRSMIGELLVFDEELKSAFSNKTQFVEWNEKMEAKTGMTLKESAYRKMLHGDTSYNEVLRVI